MTSFCIVHTSKIFAEVLLQLYGLFIQLLRLFSCQTFIPFPTHVDITRVKYHTQQCSHFTKNSNHT